MNHKKKKNVSMLAIFLVFAIMLSGCSSCISCNMNTKPETVTPTVAPTATVAPTEEVTPTEEAIATVTVAPTVTAPVVTEEPQCSPTTIPDTPTPVPTETPTPSPVPTPTLTPTPEPTATPVPTNTPTPVVKVDEKAKLLGTVKMGDNVWYDYYDDKTLVVRGKGKTKDLKEYGVETTFRSKASLEVGGTRTIIIEEGITELGINALSCLLSVERIVFPSSLKKIGNEAFASTGWLAKNTVYIGLDVTKVEIAKTAFNYCGSPENVEGLEDYTALPTPTPAPTATPTPNPSKPRVYATKKMGDNVTFEFVDNGYLYIKGTGATYDKDWTFFEFEKEPYCNTHTVIVEEGVTYLGDHVLQGLKPEVMYFPNSLTLLGNICAWSEIHGVYNGRNYVATGGISYWFFEYFEDSESAKRDGCTIVFE